MRAHICTLRRLTTVALLAFACLAANAGVHAETAVTRSFGGAVYVPSFSALPRSETVFDPLASTLVVHNVDPQSAITVTSVQFFDSAGVQVTEFLEQPIVLGPYQSRDFFIAQSGTAQGTGNNYIVRWQAENEVVEPLMIALMHGGSGTQGLSFTTTGRVIERRLTPSE